MDAQTRWLVSILLADEPDAAPILVEHWLLARLPEGPGRKRRMLERLCGAS